MQLSRILREGFIAGLIGAAAVAIWFLIVDVIAGRPFFTPAMLGSAVFWGVHDPSQVVIEYSRIIGYTMIHVSAFIIVGTISAVLAAEVEVAPHTLYLVVVFFAIFEFGFYVTVAIIAQPLLGSLAWWNVAIGNAIAAFGMGYYLWRVHPKIAATLKLHPLGEFGFYVTVAIIAQPLLGSLAWWNVAIGNAIAAFGMGYYLWRVHPKIAATLKLHPLGETDEGE